MKKATESPANRRMIERRRDVPLYSEDHGAEGKSSNSEEGEDGEESTQPLEGIIRKSGCTIWSRAVYVGASEWADTF